MFVYYVGDGAANPQTGDGFCVLVDADPDYVGATGYSLNLF